MRIISQPRLSSLRDQPRHFNNDSSTGGPSLYDLYTHFPVCAFESTYFRTTWPSRRPYPNGTWADVSTPIRERPQPLRRYYTLLVIADTDEFTVCGTALDANPVEVGCCVSFYYCIVDFICPEETFAGTITAVPRGSPCALEVGVLGLPDGVFCIDG
jgi:hypothetical protein